MGVDSDLAHSAVRLTLGRETTQAQVDRVGRVLPEAIERLRALSPIG